MSEYTLTTEWVRFAYYENKWAARSQYPNEAQEAETDAEFDRWLARVKAEAWDEADAAIHEWYQALRRNETLYTAPENPYREETQ